MYSGCDFRCHQTDDVIDEISDSIISERGARIDDQRSEGAMEERKKVGYF